MSGDDRQNELAREHKERQEKRAAEQSLKGRRNTFIGAGVAVVLVAAGIVAVTTLTKKDDGKPVAATTSASPSASPTSTLPTEQPKQKTGPVSCSYKRDKSVPNKFVGLPGKKPNTKLKKWKIVTNRGTIVVDLVPEAAPCTINSLAYLNSKKFYDNQKCYRLTTPEVAAVAFLQCGDPFAKADGKNPEDGVGTAGYTFADENSGIALGKGVVFLTQPGDAAGQSNSNFGFSLSDENSQVGAGFNVVGMIDPPSMELLLGLAKTKDDLIVNDHDITGDGGSTAPRKPVIIKSMSFTTK